MARLGDRTRPRGARLGGLGRSEGWRGRGFLWCGPGEEGRARGPGLNLVTMHISTSSETFHFRMEMKTPISGLAVRGPSSREVTAPAAGGWGRPAETHVAEWCFPGSPLRGADWWSVGSLPWSAATPSPGPVVQPVGPGRAGPSPGCWATGGAARGAQRDGGRASCVRRGRWSLTGQ